MTPTFPTEKGKWEQDCYNASELTYPSCCSCLHCVEEGEPISWNWGLWTFMPQILPPRLLEDHICLLLQVEPTEQWACSHWGLFWGDTIWPGISSIWQDMKCSKTKGICVSGPQLSYRKTPYKSGTYPHLGQLRNLISCGGEIVRGQGHGVTKAVFQIISLYQNRTIKMTMIMRIMKHGSLC